MKKHQIRCRKCGRFMKRNPLFITIVLWMASRYRWCTDCCMKEDIKEYLENK